MNNAYNELPLLPPQKNIETKEILKKSIKANIELAKLNGYCSTIPNENILINSLILKEAQASSEIENIITTQDNLYKALITQNQKTDPETKEVLNYREALWYGYQLISKNDLLITKTIIEIQKVLEKNDAGIRILPGTSLVNDRTGEIIYTPPDNENTINKLLNNLEKYINTDDDNTDPLIKMAIIHYQFESIHPFYDGNGRTGRIINVLYLVLKKLLKSPILYLSDYIIKNKNLYYNYLQKIRTDGDWETFILFILDAVEKTSIETLEIIQSIRNLIEETIDYCRVKLPKTTYSKELIENLFIQPYTKIEFLVNNQIAERRTASKYLKQLEEIKVLESFKLGKENIYINKKLYELLKWTR